MTGVGQSTLSDVVNDKSYKQLGLPEKLEVTGVGITPFPSYKSAVEVISKSIGLRNQIFIAAINPEKVYRALFDSELCELLNGVDVAICDGIGSAWAARVLSGREIARITGVSLFYELVEAARKNRWKIFLLGAHEEVNRQAADQLLKDYPGLQVVGRQDGYFSDDEAVVTKINNSGADLLFVAMGSPRQEKWIHKNRGALAANVLMGVGGTLDVVSGKVKRAPKAFRSLGLEWLYRLLLEPSRVRRQLVYPKYVLLVIKERIWKAN